mmetsp:Transcript_24138/g.29721  ORF Transcript_24138/g.29721 Transcript_24138/m.29721 type:complete len:477 (+) Transcript_24138:82-1512(+)
MMTVNSEVKETPVTPQKPLHLLDSDSSSCTNENEESGVPTYDRNWIKKLIQKHSSDPRLTPYYEGLHEKYPILKDKALVVAPMVDQSDLPFRLLCRNYGTNLCFTPMVHAKMFTEMVGYRKKFWNYVDGTPASDRPLVVQLCGSHKESLLYTINYILSSKNGVDGFDLNCGCPQTIAKRGMYGAFLLEKNNGDTIVDIVSYLVKEVGHKVPISVKVRILPSGVEDSLNLYERLVDAGAAMLTIHGRTRLQKTYKTGQADWDVIRRAVELFGDRIPVLANGSIATMDDVRACLEHTGVDGIMSSESILEYPPIFTESGTADVDGKRTGPSRLEIAREYLNLTLQYPPNKGGQGSGMKCIRAHFHRFLHEDLGKHDSVRQTVAMGTDYEKFFKTCEDVKAIYDAEGHNVEDETLSWYMRHRVVDEDGIPFDRKRHMPEFKHYAEKKTNDPDEEAATCMANFFSNDDDDYDEDSGEQCW